MARELDQIVKELDAGYNPSRALINQKLAEIPGQAAAQEAGLKAQQTDAFDNILAGARNRGLGFSGIPVQEQAKYTASEFLPAVARLKQSTNDSKMSLVEALNQTNLDQRNRAMGLRQTELDRDEAARQFNEKVRLEKEAQAEAQRQAARAAAASGSWLGGLSGGGSGAGGGSNYTPSLRDTAYSNVQSFMNRGRAAAESDYQATKRSADRGNALDKLKIELYNQAGIGVAKPNRSNNNYILSGLSSGSPSVNGLSRQLPGLRF